MKNKIMKTALVVCAIIITTACSDNDNATGYSTNIPTAPSLTVTLDFENTQSLVEQEATYGFTVSISEPQITNVRVQLSQTGGTATADEDFSFPSTVTIPAGSTSVSDVITIHADELAEETETAVIQIATGNESNVSPINGSTVTFNITNLTSGDLSIGLTWAASDTVTNNYGEEIDPTDLANLRLLITNVPYTGILTSEDSEDFETFTFLSTFPDGEFYVVADVKQAMNISSDLDLELTFDQIGKINGQTYSFPKALSTDFPCSERYFVLAKLTKVGEDFTIEEVGQNGNLDLTDYIGTWTGNDIYGSTEVTTTLNSDGKLEITGIGVTFMTGPWAETIIDQENLVMDIDLLTGEFTIGQQYYMETTYLGDPQPVYDLSGTGTINPCTRTMDLVYDFVQDGTSYTAWLTPYGYEFHEINVLQ